MIKRLLRRPDAEANGHTLVEFALCSLVFFMITIGTIDVGRAVFLYSEMNSAVRDAAREAKVSDANGYGYSNGTISHRVHVSKNLINGVEKNRPGLTSVTSSVSCTGSCQPGDLLTVNANLTFTPVIANFLGVTGFTMHSSATVKME